MGASFWAHTLPTLTTNRTPLPCNGHQDVTNSGPGNGTKMLGPFGIEGNNIKDKKITT